jgi:hypothetical protein
MSRESVERGAMQNAMAGRELRRNLMQEDPMQEGDHVAVTVSDEVVGTGRIVKAGDVRVSVLVERPHGGPYPFGAPRAWFQPVGPKQWRIDMPATARGELMGRPPEDDRQEPEKF